MDNAYNGIKFYNDFVLSDEDYIESMRVIDSFDSNSINVPVNTIFELETAKKIIESQGYERKYDSEVVDKYRQMCDQVLPFLAKWFAGLNDKTFLDSIVNISTDYFEDFLEYFSKFRAYEKISNTAFEEFLNMPDIALYKILKYPNIVKHFDEVIAEFMRTSSQSPRILINKFLESSEEKYYLPTKLLPSEFENIFLTYINSERVHPNALQLIFTAKNSKECPISDKTKLAAQRKYDAYWKTRTNEMIMHGYGVGVSFADVKETKLEIEDGNTYHFTYDIKWLEENLDYPTILNNFIYVFEFFNGHFCPTFVSVNSKIGALESVLMVKGKDCFKKGHQFVISNMLASSQMALYYQFLKNKKIEFEKIFQWFFETYLKDEFDAEGFSFTPSSENTTYLEKIRNLASEMDGVLKQYNMFVSDGCIDRELFEMSSEHIVFSNIKSQLKDKYAYFDDMNTRTAMFYLFSDQSVLSYTDKTKDEYRTLFSLLKSEKMVADDFKDHQKSGIDWLIENKYLCITTSGTLALCRGKVLMLKEYYDNDVLCLKYSKHAKDCFENFSVVDTLFSKPEQNYLNYMLNKATYSDGKDLRNKYIHSTYPRDEETQKKDYIDLLKIMIIIIVKINEEFCLKEIEKTEAE